MLRRISHTFMLLVLTLICLSVSSHPAAAQYNLTDLGQLDPTGNGSFGTAINDLGQVVGYSLFSTGHENAFRTAPYSRINANTDTIPLPNGFTDSIPFAINTRGDVVGQASTQLGGYTQTGFVYENGVSTLPGSPGQPSSSVTAINNSGLAVVNQGFLFYSWQQGTLDLNTAGNGIGYGINNVGQIVGFDGLQAFLRNPPTTSTPFSTYKSLGFLPGGNLSEAHGINGKGQIVGWSTVASGNKHAFLYDNGAIKDMGVLSGSTDSEARAINDAGQIVGVCYVRNGSVLSGFRGFLYTNGRMVDLTSQITGNTSQARIYDASGINNLGAIAVTAVYQNRYLKASLLWQSPHLASLTLDRPVIQSRQSATGIITLTRPAGPDGLTVTLSTNAPSFYLTVPASVQIPAGATVGTFTVTAGFEAIGAYTITATNGTESKVAPIALTSNSFSPIADSSVAAGSLSGANLGANTRLFVSKQTADASSSNNRCAYLKFDFTALNFAPPYAFLYLTIAPNSGPPGKTETVKLYDVSDNSWTETGLTFNNAPGLNRDTFTGRGTLIATQSIVLQPGVIVLDITSFATAHQGQIATLLLIDENAENLSLVLNSREAATGKPVLALVPFYQR